MRFGTTAPTDATDVLARLRGTSYAVPAVHRNALACVLDVPAERIDRVRVFERSLRVAEAASRTGCDATLLKNVVTEKFRENSVQPPPSDQYTRFGEKLECAPHLLRSRGD